MDVCYYAVKTMTLGDEVRQPGDLLPEVSAWHPRIRDTHLRNMRIAPVLVISLPKPLRDEIEAWERDYYKASELIEDTETEMADEADEVMVPVSEPAKFFDLKDD